MLNFSDFARYAPDRKAIIRGNAWGLPVNWTAFALTSVIVSAASVKVYGSAVLDPADLLQKVNNNTMFFIGSIVFVVATIGFNIDRRASVRERVCTSVLVRVVAGYIK